MRVFLLLVLSIIPLCAAGYWITAEPPPEFRAMEERIDASVPAPLREQVKDFYRGRDGKPLWLKENGGWNEDPRPFAQALALAWQEGLKPEHYPLARWMEDAGKDPLLAEVMMTATVMRYIHDLKLGRVDPETLFPRFTLAPRDTDLVTPLREAFGWRVNLPRHFAAIAPRHRDYRALRDALAYYLAAAEKEDWRIIPPGGTIRPGQHDARIPDIRKRLQRLGMLEEDVREQSDLYDPDTETAIRQLQVQQRLKADGLIGAATLESLNLSPHVRASRIRLAMEQWRWLPHPPEGKYVLVNTAGFYAIAMDGEDAVLRMPVIVGEAAHETPAFSSTITDVKFYPDWSVPTSIVKRYLLERIHRNPQLIDARGYELRTADWQPVPRSELSLEQLSAEDFPPYRIRQKPGPKNALGLVRFSVENHYSIYLHDTPEGELFGEADRSLSSGCIRVGDPVRLAQFLLAGNSDLSAAEVADRFRVEAGTQLRTKVIPLQRKIPVHIVYMTAWVDEEGVVRFSRDLYARDGRLQKAMESDGT